MEENSKKTIIEKTDPETGKKYKIFGPHDNDGLKMLRNRLTIEFISADEKGFSITKKRIVDDMGFYLSLVTEGPSTPSAPRDRQES